MRHGQFLTRRCPQARFPAIKRGRDSGWVGSMEGSKRGRQSIAKRRPTAGFRLVTHHFVMDGSVQAATFRKRSNIRGRLSYLAIHRVFSLPIDTSELQKLRWRTGASLWTGKSTASKISSDWGRAGCSRPTEVCHASRIAGLQNC